MTSVDSGVETGNDSNDSLVTQHESLTGNQTGGTTTATAIATASSGQRERPDNEYASLRINVSPIWSVGVNLPMTSMCPIHWNNNRTEFNQNSETKCGLTVVEDNDKSFLAPTNSFVQKKLSYARKMRSLHLFAKSHHCFRHDVAWKELHGLYMERKMRLAAATNNTIMMKKILSRGFSPNIQDEHGRTPLHLASCRGFTDMVRLLLEFGADPNRRDCIGNTPLHLAIVTCKISVVTLLLKAGTNLLSLGQCGYNPLRLAETKLRMLQNCSGTETMRIKEEVHSVINMLLVYLQKQRDTAMQIETLSTFCSRLSLSNTSDQVQDDVKDLLKNINSLSITS